MSIPVINNISRPGRTPEDGDWVEFDYDGIIKERREFHTPVVPEKSPRLVNMATIFAEQLTDTEQEDIAVSATKAAKVFLMLATVGYQMRRLKARTLLSRVFDAARANELVP